MATLNIDSLVPLYQDAIDQLINALGKNILVVFKPTVVSTTDAVQDDLRGEGVKSPSFKGAGPTVAANVSTIIGLIKYNPADYIKYFGPIEKGQNIVRIKTFLTNLDDLTRAQYVIPSYDARKYVQAKYKLLREPIPIGLQEDRYCVTFWERAA